MDGMDAREWLQLLLGPAGVTVVFAAILWAGMRRKWVWYWIHEEVRQDRDEWKKMALDQTRVAERGTEVATVASQAVTRLPTIDEDRLLELLNDAITARLIRDQGPAPRRKPSPRKR